MPTNTTLQEEIFHRLERMQTGGATLPRDVGNPPAITLAKMISRINEFTDL